MDYNLFRDRFIRIQRMKIDLGIGRLEKMVGIQMPKACIPNIVPVADMLQMDPGIILVPLNNIWVAHYMVDTSIN